MRKRDYDRGTEGRSRERLSGAARRGELEEGVAFAPLRSGLDVSTSIKALLETANAILAIKVLHVEYQGTHPTSFAVWSQCQLMLNR